LNGTKRVSTREALQGAPIIGLYFTASWCPPCRGFTPQFIESYQGVLQKKGLRTVVIPRDRDLQSFQDYYAQMPFLALPFEEQELNASLGQRFGVQTIPNLTLLDAEGKIITTEARNSLVQDPKGDEFPWYPPLVRDLGNNDIGRLNEIPSLMLLCEGVTKDERQHAEANLIEVAKECGLDDFGFFIASGGPLAGRVRELCQLPEGGEPQLIVMDIPNTGFYVGASAHDALTAGSMRDTITGWQEKNLEFRSLTPPSQ